MATLSFDDNEDPTAASRAVVSLLSWWLNNQVVPERATPATARCQYDDEGNLRVLTVTLGED